MTTLKRITKALVVFGFTGLTFAAHAVGPGLTGGGNWQEADFALSARTLHRILSANPTSEATLGVKLADLDQAISQTQVVCAVEPTLGRMRSLNKVAYYDSTLGLISLDCANYTPLLQSGLAKSGVILHEYMRRVVGEGSEYRVSSKLAEIFVSVTINVNIQIPTAPQTGFSFEQCVEAAKNNDYEETRVKQKWFCISRFTETLTFDQCLRTAQSHYYEASKVAMKKVCSSISTNLNQCFNLAKSHYYEAEKVSSKADCLRRFDGQKQFDLCQTIADSNYYSADKARFREYCLGMRPL